MPSSNVLLAFVGMPGSGKSEAAHYIKQKGIPVVRLGDLTEKAIREKGLQQTPETEAEIRESLRKEFGMAVYAQRAEQKIADLLAKGSVIVDGLYSWEEYVFLQQKFPAIKVAYVYAEPSIRYERLSKRKVRPFSFQEARNRDVAEIERLHKGGPIAIADFLITNNDTIEHLYSELNTLFARIHI